MTETEYQSLNRQALHTFYFYYAWHVRGYLTERYEGANCNYFLIKEGNMRGNWQATMPLSERRQFEIPVNIDLIEDWEEIPR